MNTGTTQAERIVSIMMCSHSPKSTTGTTTVCNHCGLVFDYVGTLRGVVNIMNRIGRDIALDISEGIADRFSVCNHTEKEFDGGTPFCIRCGLVFEDETVYSNGYTGDSNHHPTHGYDDHNTYTTRRRERTTESEPEPKTKSAAANVTETTTPSTVVKTSPKTKNDLIKLAKERGIKSYTLMSKKKLCEALDIEEPTRPDRILLTNKETGEEHRFKSTYQASKEMGSNSATIRYCIGKDITIDKAMYTVSEI